MKCKVIVLFICWFFCSCNKNAISQTNLKPINKVRLSISEPSGITFYKNNLYIVSDSKYYIYKTTLQGKIIDKIAFSIRDLEGVTVNKDGNFVVVSESKRTLVKLDSTGLILKKTKIKGKQKDKNSGLEGVCYNSLNNTYYLLNEKSPKQLLNINEDGDILETIKISFAKDLSGLSFDAETGNLWLLSDESECIYYITSKGKLLHTYTIPVNKPEGIVVVNNKIYIVSDSLSTMFVFKKPN